VHKYRIVIAVDKHIVAQDALTGGCVIVRTNKSTNCGIIVAGLEVIEASFSIVGLATGVFTRTGGGYAPPGVCFWEGCLPESSYALASTANG